MWNRTHFTTNPTQSPYQPPHPNHDMRTAVCAHHRRAAPRRGTTAGSGCEARIGGGVGEERYRCWYRKWDLSDKVAAAQQRRCGVSLGVHNIICHAYPGFLDSMISAPKIPAAKNFRHSCSPKFLRFTISALLKLHRNPLTSKTPSGFRDF